ncbi:MAG: hypothetical protein FWE63_00530 [Bacteroidales bacterium]|nr:hypothetical protein [Bacteroidales bacterium]
MSKIKCVIIVLLYTCYTGCCANQNNNKINEKQVKERLDIERLEREAEKTVYDDGGIFYYLEDKEEDGTNVIIQGDKIDGFTEKRTSESSYYWNYKKYYPNGIIKEKGTFFSSTSIELWHSFDEQGNLIKTEDKDKKFGKFGYKDVLSFLIENNYVEEVEKGACKSVFKITITFSVEDLIWRIIASDTYFMVNDYVLDGNTGEIKEHKVYQGGQM